MTEPKANQRVVLYLRRSVDDKDETRSLPEQKKDCEEHAKGIGPIVGLYQENESGVTGKDRPKFVSMIEAAERGEFDAIVCLDGSRFGRFEIHEWGYWLHRLERARVAVKFVHGDLSGFGEMAPIMGAMTQHSDYSHSLNTARKVTRGHIAAVEKGCWPGGIAPFGYRLVKRPGWDGKGRRDSTLVIKEDEAKIVREVYRLYLSGLGYQRLVDAINAQGHRTRKGVPFKVSAVIKMLSNPVYMGNLSRGKPRRGLIRPELRSASKFYRGSSAGPVKASEHSDGYEKRGAVPALVSPEDWERVQEIAREKGIKPSGGRPGLFVGLAKCGVCGGPLTQMTYRAAGGKRSANLKCRRCRERGTKLAWGECRYVSVNYPALRDRVVGLLREEDQPDPEELAREIRAALPNVPKVDVQALETRRKRLAARRDELLLSDDEFARAGLAKLSDEHARLTREIEAAKQAERISPDVEAMVQAAVEANLRLESPGTDEGDEALRDLFGLYVKRIKVDPAPFKTPRPVEVEFWTTMAVAIMSSGAHTTLPDLTRRAGCGSRSSSLRSAERSLATASGRTPGLARGRNDSRTPTGRTGAAPVCRFSEAWTP